MTVPMLDLRDVGKSFTLHALDRRITGCQHVSLIVQPGEFVGITGRSGSGKSTVLRLIYRTYLPESGEMRYDSSRFGLVDLARASERMVLYLRRYEIGYVSQFLQVIPRTTAREVVEGAARAAGADPADARAATERLLAHVELPRPLWDSYPYGFSGGERLRLNIARALVTRPRILLLDEPTASLDAIAKARVGELLAQLRAEGATMLGIFHDLEFMGGVCDREYRMEGP